MWLFYMTILFQTANADHDHPILSTGFDPSFYSTYIRHQKCGHLLALISFLQVGEVYSLTVQMCSFRCLYPNQLVFLTPTRLLQFIFCYKFVCIRRSYFCVWGFVLGGWHMQDWAQVICESVEVIVHTKPK